MPADLPRMGRDSNELAACTSVNPMHGAPEGNCQTYTSPFLWKCAFPCSRRYAGVYSFMSLRSQISSWASPAPKKKVNLSLWKGNLPGKWNPLNKLPLCLYTECKTSAQRISVSLQSELCTYFFQHWSQVYQNLIVHPPWVYDKIIIGFRRTASFGGDAFQYVH